MIRLAAVVCAALAQDGLQSPLSPQKALGEFRIDAGLRMELVAAEPEIESPVAMAFDEDGRLYVVEMLDYPVAGAAPLGRIKRLEDRDGDGRYEHAIVFADKLLMANGVMPWKGGVIVTAAPHILYLKDTDGDGRADAREILYEGFTTQNPQLRVSQPTLGIDNWVYVANGLRGGKLKRSGRSDAKAIDINGMDFRFDLVGDRAEPVSGMGQFGLTFDDWGRRFVCTNRNQLIPIPMENRYFARNAHLAAPPPVRDNNSPGGAARIYPISRNKTLSAAHAGTFTASCGVTIYRGDAFTCEPTGNLVHREILTPAGATFTARPAREGVEFLASADTWFRPVNLSRGPDGALYVVDMYRPEVEHPDWVPADQKYRYNFDGRKDFGRIWRVVFEKLTVTRPQLSKASNPELVALLEHPNAWWRMTAHRLLIERRDATGIDPLRALSPEAKVHSAWLLDGLGALDAAVVIRLLGDPNPRVRENAAILAERFIAKDALIQRGVAALAEDTDGRVRFQAALALSAHAVEPLAKILRAGADDRWTRLAVASALNENAGQMISAVPIAIVQREFAALVASRGDRAEIAALLDPSSTRTDEEWRAVLLGLSEGMGRRGQQLSAFIDARAEGLMKRASAYREEAPVEERMDAVRLLGHLPWSMAGPALEKLLAGDLPQPVRVAAIGALSAHRRPEVGEMLMRGWRLQMPAARREILEAIARESDRIQHLLGEIEAERVSTSDLGASLVQRLVTHKQADLRDRAKKLLQAARPEDRVKILERYRAALGVKGDRVRGRAVFEKNCGACHRIGTAGTNVGPDISDTLAKSPETLLTDILDPSRAIDANYVNYIVRMRSGAVLSGFVAEQNASSLTLRRGDNQQNVVLRQDIEEMKSSGVSLMPDGVEKGITVEEMSDLLAFLKNWRD